MVQDTSEPNKHLSAFLHPCLVSTGFMSFSYGIICKATHPRSRRDHGTPVELPEPPSHLFRCTARCIFSPFSAVISSTAPVQGRLLSLSTSALLGRNELCFLLSRIRFNTSGKMVCLILPKKHFPLTLLSSQSVTEREGLPFLIACSTNAEFWGV